MSPQPQPQPIPNPTPTNPNPGQIEVDTGGLHTRPEVDYDTVPAHNPVEPSPEVTPDLPEKETPGPNTDPGH